MLGTHTGHESGLGGLLAVLEGCVHEFNTCEYVDLVGGGFGLPTEPLEEQLYLFYGCSVEALANCRCQVLVGHRKGSLRFFWQV